ncbi:MAG: hypothetical protein K1X72_02145 [Pyrinomonadaceae bacterium]|nr:hypothetical protein [Pyrinomonadaceae bacterium]
MQISQTENEMIIRETPGCLWFFGLFFAVIGGLFVYGSWGGFTNYDGQSFWTVTITFLMGSIAFITGIWLIYRAPVTRVVINRREDFVSIVQYGLFGRQYSEFDFEEIEQFYLIEERDGEGDLIWSLGMKLTDDETIKISSLPSHDERFKQDFAMKANIFMGKQLPACQLIFDSEDESEEEIS